MLRNIRAARMADSRWSLNRLQTAWPAFLTSERARRWLASWQDSGQGNRRQRATFF